MNDFWINLCDKRLNVPRFVSLNVKEKIVSGSMAENKESKLRVKTKVVLQKQDGSLGWITHSYGRHIPDNEHQEAV